MVIHDAIVKRAVSPPAAPFGEVSRDSAVVQCAAMRPAAETNRAAPIIQNSGVRGEGAIVQRAGGGSAAGGSQTAAEHGPVDFAAIGPASQVCRVEGQFAVI